MAGEDRAGMNGVKARGPNRPLHDQQDEFFRFSQFINSEVILRCHYNTMLTFEKFVHDEVAAGRMEQGLGRASVQEHLNQMCKATFLCLFSHAEEELENMARARFRSELEQVRDYASNSSVERFKCVIRDGFGIDLMTCTQWKVLKDAATVRNALLHCGGVIHHLPKSKKRKVEEVLRTRTDVLLRSGRLYVTEAWIDHVAKAFQELHDRMVDSLVEQAKQGDPRPPV